MNELLGWTQNYGLGVVLALAITLFASRLFVFVLKQNAEREERLAAIIEIHIKELASKMNDLSKVVEAHDKNETISLEYTKEAQRYQRQEHKEMTDALIALKQELIATRPLIGRIT